MILCFPPRLSFLPSFPPPFEKSGSRGQWEKLQSELWPAASRGRGTPVGSQQGHIPQRGSGAACALGPLPGRPPHLIPSSPAPGLRERSEVRPCFKSNPSIPHPSIVLPRIVLLRAPHSPHTGGFSFSLLWSGRPSAGQRLVGLGLVGRDTVLGRILQFSVLWGSAPLPAAPTFF